MVLVTHIQGWWSQLEQVEIGDQNEELCLKCKDALVGTKEQGDWLSKSHHVWGKYLGTVKKELSIIVF